VLYAYHESSPTHRSNLLYFFSHALCPTSTSSSPTSSSSLTILIVINGEHTIPASVIASLPPAFAVVERLNTCFDFGAWSFGVEYLQETMGMNKFQFDYYMFLNGSVKGPLGGHPWVEVRSDEERKTEGWSEGQRAGAYHPPL